MADSDSDSESGFMDVVEDENENKMDDDVLFFAIENENTSAALHFIERARQVGFHLGTSITAAGDTVLITAIAYNMPSVALAIIDADKTISAHVNDKGETALFHAIHKKMADVAIALVQSGYSLPGYIHEKSGNTALIFAIQRGMPVVALAIIATGKSNPSHLDVVGRTALMYAVEAGMENVAMAIIATAQYNKDYETLTAMRYARRNGLPAVVDALSARMAPPMSVNINRVCFHVAENTHVRARDFLAEDDGNIVIMVVTKTSAGALMSADIAPLVGIHKSRFSSQPEKIYECKRPDTMRPKNILLVPAYVDIKKIIGMGDLAMMTQLIEVIVNGKSSVYSIAETDTKFASTVNEQVLGSDPNYVSARHCQSGQGATLYLVAACTAIDGAIEPMPSSYTPHRTQRQPNPVTSARMTRSMSIASASRPRAITVQIGNNRVSIPIQANTTIGEAKQLLIAQLNRSDVNVNVNVNVRILYRGRIMQDAELASSIDENDVVNAMVSARIVGGRTRTTRRRTKSRKYTRTSKRHKKSRTCRTKSRKGRTKSRKGRTKSRKGRTKSRKGRTKSRKGRTKSRNYTRTSRH